MLNQNDIGIAQERYADMRREAAQERERRRLLGRAQPAAMQRFVAVVAKLQQRMTHEGKRATPTGTAMPGKAA